MMTGSTALTQWMLFDKDGGGGGAGTGDAGAGEGGGSGAGDVGAGAGDAGAGDGGGEGAGGEGGKDHWSDTIDLGENGDALREHLVKSGFHKAAGPEAALSTVLKAHMSAEKHLGKSADRMLELPGEGDDLAEWRKSNAERLGVPTGDDTYTWERGELPKDMFWDQDREAKFFEAAKARGVPADIVTGFMDDYRDMMKADYEAIVKEIADTSDALRSELTKDWGGNVSGNLALARRALMHFGAEAKLPAESLHAIEAKMMDGTEIKDAQIARLFFSIGRAMGEDMAAGDIMGGGGSGFAGSATRGELQAEKTNIMRANDGLLAKARAAGNTGEVERLNARLSEINKRLL